MDKYKDTISKIQASEELKQKIIQNMKNEKNKVRVKGVIVMKIKHVLITIASFTSLFRK